MDSPERNDSEASQKRRRISWVLSGVGLVLLLAGVFHLTGSTVGGRVHDFSERRTYIETKRKLHEAFPLAGLLGFGGLGLMIIASRYRAR